MNRSTSEANGRNTAVSAFITQKGEKMYSSIFLILILLEIYPLLILMFILGMI